ncbi:hypothetical protein JCM10207_007594 [Rhodosporidiobolus poonsookiae]
MNAKKSATQVANTLSRQLKGGFVSKPPPSFYPLLAHPPPPSLVRSFPDRTQKDLPPRAHATTRSPASQPRSLYAQAKDKLDRGIRLTAQEDAALLDPSGQSAAVPTARDTRRKPPRAANTKHPRPWAIVFPEDSIRQRFFADHPFEAYRPVSVVEGEKVAEVEGPAGQEWTELSQRSTNPSAEDCISYILNLVEAHSLPLARAYPHGIAQFRTLRAEHETSTRAAQLEAQSFGAVFFGEIDRTLAVEERVLDEWVGAREIQNAMASAGGPGAVGKPQATVQGVSGTWAPAEARPASVLGTEDESLFSGGVEYLQAFARQGGAVAGGVSQGEGKIVGVAAA